MCVYVWHIYIYFLIFIWIHVNLAFVLCLQPNFVIQWYCFFHCKVQCVLLVFYWNSSLLELFSYHQYTKLLLWPLFLNVASTHDTYSCHIPYVHINCLHFPLSFSLLCTHVQQSRQDWWHNSRIQQIDADLFLIYSNDWFIQTNFKISIENIEFLPLLGNIYFPISQLTRSHVWKQHLPYNDKSQLTSCTTG